MRSHEGLRLFVRKAASGPVIAGTAGWLALCLLALCGLGCGSGETPSSRLDSAEPLGAGTLELETCGERRQLSLEKQELVCVERSWRRSMVTTAGAEWVVSVPPSSARRRLEIAFAPLTEARVVRELDMLEGKLPLNRSESSGPASPEDGWTRRVYEVPAGVDRMRLASDAPVAWTMPFMLADPEPDRAAPDRPSQARPGQARPNLILVILDTLRADSLGLDGYERATSPGLEKLALDSVHFPHSLSASTCTQPSTASLLSGLTPLRHGVRAGLVLPESAQTFVETLRDAGYRTAAITDGGFVAPSWGFAQGFDRYDATGGDSWVPKDVAPIIESAIAWLEQNRFEPFFLLVHTYETHMPYTDPEGFAADFLDPSYQGPFERRGVIKLDGLAGLRDADRSRLRDLYDGEVRRADYYVHRLIEALDRMGLYDRVGLLLTSDHGEEFFEYGSAEHGFGRVYDPHVRVPMLLKPPGAPRGGGARSSCPASGLDVAPTLLAMAGLPAPEGWLGRSLLDPCPGQDERPRPILAHGLSAFPKNTELERFRLDRGSRSVLFDRQTGLLQAFELRPDGTLGPRVETVDEATVIAGEHLQALLAWSEAPHVVRLEVGQGELIVPDRSRFEALGVYDGLRRVEGERRGDAVHFRLGSGSPVYLLAEIGPGADFELVHGLAGERRRLPITTRTEGGERLVWRPLGDYLPPPWVIFEGATGLEAESRQMTPEEEAELRSLGYL